VNDQQNFLLSFWRSRLIDTSNNAESLADGLLELFSKYLDNHIMGIPPQMLMLAEACEKYVSTCPSACVYLPENMNLLHLHEKSVMKNVEIYCRDKTNIDTIKPHVKTCNEYWHNSFLKKHIQPAVTFVHPH
jgi:hypothetical protein